MLHGMHSKLKLCKFYYNPNCSQCGCSKIVSNVCANMNTNFTMTLKLVKPLLFQTGVGVGIAANIRIGHYLGGNNPIGAKSAYRTAITLICKLAFWTNDFLFR